MVDQVGPDYQHSQIAQFYNEKSVFITGATGFLGKVMVEKLLRSTKVQKIYLLIRPKKGIQTKIRLEELMSAKIFNKLKETSSDLMSRVDVVSGDITEPNFGLSEEDEKKLIDNVSVVFHSAATIKFDEELTKAVNLNVVAVFTIMEICKKMKKLQALVHISTAYCNPQLKHIPEEIINNNGDPVGIIDLCKTMDASVLNSPKMTKEIIGDKPNTYTFTKALGEAALVEGSGVLPIVIVRPSIVVASWKEPLPGWIENLNGPTGIVAGAGKGILRTALCKVDKVADFIPVDIPINLAICVAWKIANQPSNMIPVYNCTSSAVNPITWGQLLKLGFDAVYKYPMENCVWYPGGSYQEYWLANYIMQVLLHTIPAYIADGLSVLVGKKPVMRTIVQKMHKAQKVVEYFALHEWKWAHDNVEKLHTELTEVDKKCYNFEVRNLNWAEYMVDYVLGTRQYIFKEDLSTLEEARKHQNKMYWIEKCFQIIFLALFVKFLCWAFFC